jgi:DNA-binding transcriptional ArsR family regulator
VSEPSARVFSALADPTRREILAAVADRGSATATELANGLPVSRQAVAKHLLVLQAAGLVAPQRAGRETRFTPTPAPLGEAIGWMTALGARWDGRLAALQRAAARRADRSTPE